MYVKHALLSFCLLGTFSTIAVENLNNNDPLTSHQWHLNTNDSASTGLNLVGSDLVGIKGQGVTVTIIDGGVELTHPDLWSNVTSGSINLRDSNQPLTDSEGHGTAVAGIIAATENNNLGGRGVAPSAKIIGFNYLESQSISNWLLSHGFSDDELASSRVFNQSYSSKPTLFTNVDASLTMSLKEHAMKQVVLDSNDGLGALFIKSAGNAYQQYNTFIGDTEFQIMPYENQERFNNFGLPFHNANISADNASFWNLVVSAYNAEGKLASYSSVGANVFLTAPGGEYSQDGVGITTTDLTGCDLGYNRGHDNTLNNLGIDPSCDATTTMYGTSAAAANTSGAVALVMSANPQLDARTVKHVLAKTARKIDQSNLGVALTFTDNSDNFVSYSAIDGWQQNNAGYNYHYFYGLGAIDVDAAVTLAKETTSNLPPLKTTAWQTHNNHTIIPDASLNGAQDSMSSNEALTIEAVQLKVSIDHARFRDLAIELISPAGTRSVLLSPRTGLININNDSIENAVLLTQHFYGESSLGDWKIRLIDTDKGNSQTLLYNEKTGLLSMNDENNSIDGVLKSWSLRFYGH